MKIMAWSFVALVIGSAKPGTGAEPALPPLVATQQESGPEARLPGGYYRGLTKPLMVDIDARLWGPGIATPPPGGKFLAKIPGSKTPLPKSRPATSRPKRPR